MSAQERGPAALVFGPEPSGLTTAEISQCHSLMHVPANPEFPSLNLAQAVAICLYELHQSWRLRNEVLLDTQPPAPFADLERMYEHLRSALEEVHFLYGPNADALMHALRHLIGKAQPSETQVRILHGLARQLEWMARNGPGQPQSK
jgi:tRNA/rRNA methyltransferase